MFSAYLRGQVNMLFFSLSILTVVLTTKKSANVPCQFQITVLHTLVANLISRFCVCVCVFCTTFTINSPDMTFAVDWSLSNNYLSIYHDQLNILFCFMVNVITFCAQLPVQWNSFSACLPGQFNSLFSQHSWDTYIMVNLTSFSI